MKKLTVIIIGVILLVSLQGCGKSSGNGTGNLKGEKVENYSVKVVYNGAEVKSYSIEDIKKMTTSSFEIDGSKEEGPSITNILSENNIKDYSKISFVGMYKDSVSMTKEEIEKGTLLDITNHDTVKLATKAINKDKWVKDIATIKVEK